MARRFITFSRNFTTTKALRSFVAENAEAYLKDAEKWKKIFYFICCPAIIIGGLNSYLDEPPKRLEFIKYSHLRIRNKPYPWRDGVKTLFHNPHVNALPDGYETEDHH